MPGPVIPKRPNVFTENLPGPIRGLVETIFPPDDLGIDPVSTATPVAPLISIFRDRAARELGTKAFQESSQQFGPNIARAAERLAITHPRVAAHMRLVPGEGYPASVAAAAQVPFGRVRQPVDVAITPFGSSRMRGDPKIARDIVHHEATHVAQGLGNRNTRQLYGDANDLMSYQMNPFETTARQRGATAAALGVDPRLEGPIVPATTRLRQTVAQVSPDDDITETALDALKRLRNYFGME